MRGRSNFCAPALSGNRRARMTLVFPRRACSVYSQGHLWVNANYTTTVTQNATPGFLREEVIVQLDGMSETAT